MTSQAKARAARMQALLNDDGTVTPTAQLPDGLLVQESQSEAENPQPLIDSATISPIQSTRVVPNLSNKSK